MEHARTRTWAVPGPKQCRVLAVTSGWETSLSPLDMSVKNHVDVKESLSHSFVPPHGIKPWVVEGVNGSHWSEWS